MRSNTLISIVLMAAFTASCASTNAKVSEISKDGAELTLHVSADANSIIGKFPEKEAKKVKESIVSNKTLSTAMLLSVAELSVLSGQLEEAEKEARSQLKVNTKQVSPYKTLMKTAILRNKPAEALLVAKNGLALSAKDPDLLALQGVAFFMLNDILSARESWRMALKFDPEHIPSLMNMGVLYFHNRSIAFAGKSFEKVLRQQSNHVDAQLGKALVLSLQGQHEEGKTILTQLAEKFPKNHLVIYNLAVIEKERFQNAKAALGWIEKYVSVAKVDRSLMERAMTMRQELREELKKKDKVTDEDIRSLAKEKSKTVEAEQTAEAPNPTVQKQAAAPRPVAPAPAPKPATPPPAPAPEAAKPTVQDDIRLLEESLK